MVPWGSSEIVVTHEVSRNRRIQVNCQRVDRSDLIDVTWPQREIIFHMMDAGISWERVSELLEMPSSANPWNLYSTENMCYPWTRYFVGRNQPDRHVVVSVGLPSRSCVETCTSVCMRFPSSRPIGSEFLEIPLQGVSR